MNDVAREREELRQRLINAWLFRAPKRLAATFSRQFSRYEAMPESAAAKLK